MFKPNHRGQLLFTIFSMVFVGIIIYLILSSNLIHTHRLDVTAICGFLMIVPLTGVVGVTNDRYRKHISFVALMMTFILIMALGISFMHFELAKRLALGLGFFAASTSVIVTIVDTVFQNDHDTKEESE
ncbi:hypothetical protein CT113_10670 [Levilactobacillus brevis]|uniref:hypothetical protein n=1 Tax=Levilactobacillus brevis TaxID=1580 RepID=UPI0004645669|nr:hypothetical protein [Levilactobacillus brevis]ARN93429.1 hypothetical protein AZI11_11270 [Levilactobacillus brevis]ARN96029.1 hypothetical protein AZI12_11305 [Levilactobacillus brevis]ATU70762.1 hypothetical protein CT113_10670 [Levilactobacillus brevis]